MHRIQISEHMQESSMSKNHSEKVGQRKTEEGFRHREYKRTRIRWGGCKGLHERQTLEPDMSLGELQDTFFSSTWNVDFEHFKT